MNRTTLLLFLVLTFLAGCALTGTREGEGRFVGVIDKRSHSTRFEEPSNALFALGITGLLMRENIREQGVPVFHYVIKTPEGEVTADAGEAYAVGDCVEVSGKLLAGASRKFASGETQMTRSSRCF